MIAGILFDLDGTLLDTAPDMGGALNELLNEKGLSALTPARIRPWVSHGSGALVRLGFGAPPADEFELLRQRFLDLYSRRIANETRLFAGAGALLDALQSNAVPWGIVTNKPGYLTAQVLAALGLDQRARSIVSGDTLPQKKPSPEPLLHAASELGVAAPSIVYVGDAERDMLAANAAGMTAVIARFGYIESIADTVAWPHDFAVDSLAELQDWLYQKNVVRTRSSLVDLP